MGDKITDLPDKSDVPAIPLKTYQWEDIRRQKLEGRYPWTHLYKPPFDMDKWDETKEHEYEPVIPMDSTRKTSPLPTLKITTERENCTNAEAETSEVMQDKHHLCVPDNEDSEDSDEDDSEEENISEEITAEELQQRLEERYFKNSTQNTSNNEFELTETRSVSPAFSDQSHAKSDTSLSFHDRMQTQADKLKERFRNFKDQISKEHQAESTPRLKRKNEFTDGTKKLKPAKKNKFNFRKHNVKSQDKNSGSESPSELKIRTPQTSHRRFSLPRLPSFSRSRSNSVNKERERKRSQSSETESRKFFDFSFGTYPRMLKSCKTKKKFEEKHNVSKVKPRSVPSTPSVQRRSPFPRRLVSKFIDHKKEETPKEETTTREESSKGTLVTESIFISLHEDPVTKSSKETVKSEPNENEEAPPTKMEIDNKNFIFISLHEERFPEKLKKLEEEKYKEDVTKEELEIEKELQQAKTARKFHNMLRELQNERKMRARRAAAASRDDKPEPVIITEVTDECMDQSNLNLSSDIEQPEVELRNADFIVDVSSENYSFENADEHTKPGAKTFHEERSDGSQKIELDLARKMSVDESLTPRVPQKTPRKKLKNSDSGKESKESLSAFQDSVFIEVGVLDEQQQKQRPQEAITKTYIKAGLEEVVLDVNPVEQDQTTRHFEEYEKALEKSHSQSSFEMENSYSKTNSLVRLETPVPPARPSRMYTMVRKKKREMSQLENKEHFYDLDATNANYCTLPMVKPDKPRRKFRKKRTYSNSTTNTEIRCIDELEDVTISNNIVNSKQLSVSFLPLSSNVVGEPIIDYNLRETSSMIHLNLSADPPLPPKRKKNRLLGSPDGKFNSLPNYRYFSKGSLTPSEIGNGSGFQVDTEIEYADDVNSTVLTDSPPRRPYRGRNASLADDDRTSREAESLPSEKSSKNYTPFDGTDSRLANEYAVIEIETQESRRGSKIDSMSMPRRISRRVSDFFTLPRIRPPANYVPSSSQTLDHRRFPSPSRPPRRNRPNREHVYTNDENTRIDFSEEEQLNFNLATEEDTPENEDFKNLETNDIFEKMKSRPLPPPPRPTRKPKDDNKADYDRCVRTGHNNENKNYLNQNVEERPPNVTTSTWSSWERKTTVREFEIGRDGERREISTSASQCESKKEHTIARGHRELASVSDKKTKNEQMNECSNSNTRSNNTELVNKDASHPCYTTTQMSQPTALSPTKQRSDDPVNVITAAKLHVSELNVGRINVSEIDSSRLVTSHVESSSIHLNDVRTESGHVIVNSVNYSDCMAAPDQCHILDVTGRETTPMSNEDIDSVETASMRSRFSSMVPELGSDEECSNSGVKVIRPIRRKHQVHKLDEVNVSRGPSERNHPTLAELMSQILRICYSSVREALSSLFEQVVPEDHEKRNDVQAAIWVITIIVAGCLMLGLQSNEKVVHHHHWDFHFPPPN